VRFVIIILFMVSGHLLLPQSDKYEVLREKMVKEQIIDRGIKDKAILDAMKKIPRHLFVPQEVANEAYTDQPVPIGYQQTISQPYIVAYMTEVSKPDPKKKVLEIGTGSGYQAAVLAEITDTVYTIEIVPELAKESAARLRKMGYNNIVSKHGDGYKGWAEHAPYDIIIVTAAPNNIPEPLIQQLAENGRMVIPVGSPGGIQELLLLEKQDGKIKRSRLSFVRFVPFTRDKELPAP
jgi:protein-L-isoaspartate(D-aspartate) O-methyltransferase